MAMGNKQQQQQPQSDFHLTINSLEALSIFVAIIRNGDLTDDEVKVQVERLKAANQRLSNATNADSANSAKKDG